MATTVPIPTWKQFFRIAPESAFETNAATADWNIGGNGGGATGWRDLPITPNGIRTTPNVNNVFATYAAGKRAMNQQAPVEGAYSTEVNFEMLAFLELIDPLLASLMGATTRTPTAGSAALASTAFASVASLDTQPDGTEQLKFVIASSTAASSAAINIIQNGSTQETITIGTSASTVDGDYYSKGAYDGSTNAITFTVDGTVTAGMVTVSGIDLNTNVHTLGTDAPSTLKLEEGGQPKAGSGNSMFYDALTIPAMTFAYDRAAVDNMLTATIPGMSNFPAASTAGTWANDAKPYYHPLQGWTASITKGGSAFDKLVSANFTITTNNGLFAVSSGNQQSDGAVSGECEVTGTFTILPEDATEWNAFTGQTVGDYHLTFTSPNDIVDSTKWSLLFEFSELYIQNYDETTHSQNNVNMFGADLLFRTTDDSADGPVKITNICRMPV